MEEDEEEREEEEEEKKKEEEEEKKEEEDNNDNNNSCELQCNCKWWNILLGLSFSMSDVTPCYEVTTDHRK